MIITRKLGQQPRRNNNYELHRNPLRNARLRECPYYVLDVACACISFIGTWHDSCVHLFANKSSSMYSLFIPLSSHHVSSMYLYHQSIITRRRQIQKSLSLPRRIFFRFRVHVTGREDKAMKLRRAHLWSGCGLSGTVKENCAEVTRRLR